MAFETNDLLYPLALVRIGQATLVYSSVKQEQQHISYVKLQIMLLGYQGSRQIVLLNIMSLALYRMLQCQNRICSLLSSTRLQTLLNSCKPVLVPHNSEVLLIEKDGSYDANECLMLLHNFAISLIKINLRSNSIFIKTYIN